MTALDPKTPLRRELRAKRRAFAQSLSPQAREAAEQHLANRLRPLWHPGLKVVAYIPAGGEISPLPCLIDAHEMGATTGLGWIADAPETMVFRHWQPNDELIDGPLGVRQPGDDAPIITPDIILTPLVGFDDTGNRLGQGGGFYDRIFARYPDAKRIGLAWSVQRCESLPIDPWDQPLHAIITEAGMIGELTP
ncbi:5-formyltetrahydrofolate cyclo-ligase [Aquisediminimonas sediminicola]|uniref:5-formyltetrahydrofolate cyclo-ligase n=1 Tax=Alteraquisediminimonas sediminicola TaxID=2676787 RepID=UPI001C8EF27E|nr:5-formyltetrahydrofolate cyclo-ligase [Aquisediminimonas sediminicola]